MMKYQITVPNVDDFDLVEISEILAAPGDTVKIDDSVATLESEKAAMEIPSPKSGTVAEIHAKVGDKVKTDTLLITLEVELDTNENTTTKASPKTPMETATSTRTKDKEEISVQQPEPKTATEDDAKPLRASPSVRRFARELGIKLSAVSGVALKGRITRGDVAQYFRTEASVTMQSTPIKHIDYKRFGKTHLEAIGHIQRTTAKHLQKAWQSIPHAVQHDDADIDKLENYRLQLFESGKLTSKATLLPFLIKALARSLKEFPSFNASIENSENILIRDYYHIGFAVDTEKGLLVPVIRDADQKSIETINNEIKQLVQQARAGKLNSDNMSGACMTISNLGGLDSGAFTPIINAPEAAILGVSRARTAPVWDSKQFIPKQMLPLHLSYDHRLNNGVAAVHFLNYYKSLLSKPETFK